MFAHQDNPTANGGLTTRLTGLATAALVVTSMLLAACGVGPREVGAPGPALINDLAPVGAPSWAALGPRYDAPEMFPVLTANLPYQAPEMWPRVEVDTGRDSSDSLIEDLAPVGTPRTFEASEMWPMAER